MDLQSLTPEIVRKQRAHPRFGPMISAASPLPVEALDRSLVACFEEQARRHADRVAVEAAELSVTYGELNSAANRLAHYLLATRIDTNTPVAIVLDHSLDTILSLLAVLKTGGYYLCLEPTLPAHHISQLLNLSGAQLVITTSAYMAHLEQGLSGGCCVLSLDQLIAKDLIHDPQTPISPQQPARLGFTSGSTGVPKLNLQTHRDRLYSVWQSSNAYLLGPEDRHAFVNRFSTGTSSRALFSALLMGGSAHLHLGTNNDMLSWASWLDAQAITQLYMPTVAFRELSRMLPEGPNLPSIRMVYLGGQTIYRQDAEMFQRAFSPGTILVCRYSMSETSGLAHYLVDHDTILESDTLPAGYALPGRELLILDEKGRTLGFNQPGEIAVRRLPLTQGPPTDRAAITTSLGTASEDVAPLFRTADLGLLRPDGCLIHLGRKDDMVKVRGHRVALAEAESYLLQVPGVAQAAVRPFATRGGDNRLVGYVAPARGVQLSVVTIRDELSRLAPSHMVPARLVVVPDLPLTSSGKVDRMALPAPGRDRPGLGIPMVPARTPFEEVLTAIWREVLDLDEIGIHDPFLELGGDSLQAARIVSRAVREFQIELPTSVLFEAPTVADMALLITQQQAAQLDRHSLEHLLAELETSDDTRKS